MISLLSPLRVLLLLASFLVTTQAALLHTHPAAKVSLQQTTSAQDEGTPLDDLCGQCLDLLQLHAGAPSLHWGLPPAPLPCCQATFHGTTPPEHALPHPQARGPPRLT